jgi:transcriptional regulator with XRE-family HTH domain
MSAATRTTNGAAIRAIRESRGLKYRHVVDRLERLGGATAGRAHLCNIEAGRREASEALLGALAQVLNVPMDALRYGPVEAPRDSAA